MIIVGHTLVSEDLADVRFACDCGQCLGACCIEGDAGAPLSETEILELNAHINHIKPFMRAEGIAVVEQQGVFAFDVEGVRGTPLIDGRECAFVSYSGTIATCAIEQAHGQQKIPFRKPLSCHLYPIRISDYTEFDAVNYHKWDICRTALQKGCAQNIYLYEFLKDALIRKYGDDWYNELSMIIDHMKKKKSKR